MQAGGMHLRTVVSTLDGTASRALKLARTVVSEGVRVAVAHPESRAAVVRSKLPIERRFRLVSKSPVTAYRNGKRASTRSSHLPQDGLERTARVPLNIMKVVEVDSAAELTNAANLASNFTDLDLYHPFESRLDEIVSYEQRAGRAAFEDDASICTLNGTSVQTASRVSLLATSVGFRASAQGAAQSTSCAPVASNAGEMPIGTWSHFARAFDDFSGPEEVGVVTASRSINSPNARCIRTQLLVESSAAVSLLGELVASTSSEAH